MRESFHRFCTLNLPHSFAQNFQDLFALWAAGGRRTGYFVEFGTLNGRDFSNTYTLEKLGWNGIVAEPHPSYADKIPAVRNCHFSDLCVFDKTGDTVEFRAVIGRPALSAIGETQLNDDKVSLRENYRESSVQTITLNDLLDKFDAPPVIDFISIDTEGSELRILKAFDFSKREVLSFCIEHNFAERDELAAIMQSNGYRRVFPVLSGHDDWWVIDTLKLDEPVSQPDISNEVSETFDVQFEQRKAALAKWQRSITAD
jgi:FkbM family methyltransferase